MRLYRGDPVVTPDGNGYVLYGDWPHIDLQPVKVRIRDAVHEYPKDQLVCLPEYRKSNPKIDVYEDGKYIHSTNFHRTITRLKAWYAFGKTDPNRYTYKIDHRKK